MPVCRPTAWRRAHGLATGENLLSFSEALRGCESYPGIFEPFGGFADDCPIEDGYVGLPDVPGIGLERTASLAPVLAGVWG